MVKQKPKSGTREWAQHNKNIDDGCPNDCRYCYARYDAVYRFKRNTAENWKNPVLNPKKYNECGKKLDGRIMFPTTHDIHKDNVDRCVCYLVRWLVAGNEILIVSKPDPVVIARLCEGLKQWKSQITFRFTIGSIHNDVLKFWDRNAPSFEQRMAALQYAYENGWKTSVSSEPYFDEDIVKLVVAVAPYVTDVVWVGKMNKVKPRVDITGWTEKEMAYLDRMKNAQTNGAVCAIYTALKGNPKVRWKESIKKVIGLPEDEIG